MAGEREPKRKVHKVTFNIPVEVFNALDILSIRRGVSKTEVLRQAISTEYFLLSQFSGGDPLPEHPTDMDVIEERNKVLNPDTGHLN